MSWQVPKIWEDADVWIIGGGPSVTKQFGIPDEVVQSVIKGTSPPSVYSPYMKVLHDKHVIGINVAYLIGDWIDMVFFGDSAFFHSHIERLAKFPGLKVSCHPSVEKYDWIKYTPRSGKSKGISDNPKMVSWNGNSGAAAISVAANAGASRIILLGFDMKLDTANKQHWHDLYGRQKRTQEQQNKRNRGIRQKPFHYPFDRHLRGFPVIAQDAKSRGIEILNASPDSAIECFPKFTIKELLFDNS